MSLTDKIKLVLQEKNLTPSIFADEIGVQRSSISHILAGRNKPSLEIVQKIVRRFPDLGMDWIMDDENFKSTAAKRPEMTSRGTTVTMQRHQPPATSEPKETTDATVPTGKTIERVLIFYSDGTFQEFKESK